MVTSHRFRHGYGNICNMICFWSTVKCCLEFVSQQASPQASGSTSRNQWLQSRRIRTEVFSGLPWSWYILCLWSCLSPGPVPVQKMDLFDPICHWIPSWKRYYWILVGQERENQIWRLDLEFGGTDLDSHGSWIACCWSSFQRFWSERNW